MGDLLDLLGVPREWPEVFEAMVELVDERSRKAKRDDLAARARQQFGGKGGG